MALNDLSSIIQLPEDVPSFRCNTCSFVELGVQDELVSRAFSGSHGTAYLLRSVINVKRGEKLQKNLNTGLHTICALYCIGCLTEIGWEYSKCPDDIQRYKEFKSILEKVSLALHFKVGLLILQHELG